MEQQINAMVAALRARGVSDANIRRMVVAVAECISAAADAACKVADLIKSSDEPDQQVLARLKDRAMKAHERMLALTHELIPDEGYGTMH